MADIWRVTDWRLPAAVGPVYRMLIGALGSDEFGATMRKCVETLTAGARRLYLFEATDGGGDALRYFHCEPHIAEQLPAYSLRYKHLDPIGDLYKAAPRIGDLALQRVRPSDIASAGFRRRFFDAPRIVERVSVIQRSKTGWCGMNVARHASDGHFSERELDAIAGLAQLALPMLPFAQSRASSANAMTTLHLEDRFASSYPSLTQRERQVCARAAFGMSIEATALELGIAKTSVLTLRQRAYRRLGAASSRELLWLVAN
ncbi:MAG: helix-turn-helix transcriptional regulator [Croceibacterium sp.]